MTKPDWYEDAKALQREGLSIREISARVDVPRATVGDHLFEGQKSCPTCGDPMGVHAHRLGYNRCHSCERAARTASTRERAERISGWWADGETYGQIAARLGWSVQHLSYEFDHIRKHWPGLLPYRRTPEQRERIRAGRWGEAA